eukprot:gene10766-3385_t
MKKDSKELAKKLAANDPSITKLELSNQGVTGDFLKDIMPALDFNTTVTHLDLSENNIDEKYFPEIRETFLRNQTIEEFIFLGNKITEKGGKILIDGLRENYTLIDFQIDKVNLDYDEDDDHDDCLERNQQMKEEGNKTVTNVLPRGAKKEEKKVENKPAKETRPPIKKTTTPVKSTPVKATTNSSSSGGYVKPVLKSTNSPYSKQVNTTPTASSGAFVKPALKSTNSPFKTTGNATSSTTTTQKKAPVKTSTPTKTTSKPTTSSTVWSYSGPLSNEIKRIKINDKYLSKIDLSNKKVTDETSKELFSALETNRVLKKLQLNDNLLTDEAIHYMEKMFPLNTTLDTLELEGNNFTPKGIDHFCEALEKNWSLTDATISIDATDDQLDIIDDLLDRNFDKIYEEEKAKKKQNEKKYAPSNFKKYSDTQSFSKNQQTLQKKASFKKTEFSSVQLKKTDSSPVKSTDHSTPTNTVNWRDKLKTPSVDVNKPISTSSAKPSSNPFGKTVKEETSSKPVQQKELHHLLKWVNGMLWCVDFKVENFTTSFRNGRAFCEIANQIDDSVKYDSQKTGDENIKAAWDLFEKMEIDTFLDAEDVGKEQKSMMLCIKMVRDYFRAHD